MEFQNFWFLFLFLFGIEAKTQTGLSREACPTRRQWEEADVLIFVFFLQPRVFSSFCKASVSQFSKIFLLHFHFLFFCIL